MFSEDDLLPISALQHLSFCERQWGLMYLENIWSENKLTAEGAALHDRAHEEVSESRAGTIIARGLRVRSLELGLTGVADIVEFQQLDDSQEIDQDTPGKPYAVSLENSFGLWRPFPVEYKHGKPKIDHCDLVQLCAQALCLEEMLEVSVASGAIFYGQPRRRTQVSFDSALRNETIELTDKLHKMTREGKTPVAKYEKKCRSCSLFDFCLPKVTSARSVQNYLNSCIEDVEQRPRGKR